MNRLLALFVVVLLAGCVGGGPAEPVDSTATTTHTGATPTTSAATTTSASPATTTHTEPGTSRAPDPPAPACTSPEGPISGDEWKRPVLTWLSQGLVRHDWDEVQARFVNTSYQPYPAKTGQSASVSSAGLYTINETALQRWSHDLQPLKSVAIEARAVRAFGDHVAVAVNGSLAVLDAATLAEVSRIALPGQNNATTKTAHDILVHDGIAYVVDDIYVPMYVFRVDLRQPSQPQILSRTEHGGVNAHLGAQWLDIQRRQWVVHFSSQATTGTGLVRTDALSFFGMDNGTFLGRQNGQPGGMHRVSPTLMVVPRADAAYGVTLEWEHLQRRSVCSFRLTAQGAAPVDGVWQEDGHAWIVAGDRLEIVRHDAAPRTMFVVALGSQAFGVWPLAAPAPDYP